MFPGLNPDLLQHFYYADMRYTHPFTYIPGSKPLAKILKQPLLPGIKTVIGNALGQEFVMQVITAVFSSPGFAKKIPDRCIFIRVQGRVNTDNIRTLIDFTDIVLQVEIATLQEITVCFIAKLALQKIIPKMK
jgi:hypothetical protein